MQLYKYLPLASDRMGTLWALTSIKDGCIIEYGPAGTTHYGIEGFMKLNSEMRSKLYTTHMDESDIVMGDSTRLEETIKEVDSIYKPKYIFVVASSISSIIGTDIENVCDNLRDQVNAKLISFTGGGFRGDFALGIQEVLTALATHVVKPCDSKDHKSFNIIGCNADNYNFLSDIKEIENIMKECFGFNLNAVFTANSSIDEIENASMASLNIVLRAEGVECAEILNEEHGIPYIQGAPYGLNGTLTWIKAIEDALSIKANQNYVSKEMERARKIIFRFKHTIMQYRGLSAVLAGNYDFIVDSYSFFKEDLSLNLEKAFVNHGIRGNAYRKMNDSLSTLTIINPTEQERERVLKETNVSMLLADAITLEMGQNIPVKIQVANPNFNRINIYENTPFMGFNGICFIIEQLLNEIHLNSNKLKASY